LALLRAHAYAQQTTLSELASDIVERRVRFPIHRDTAMTRTHPMESLAGSSAALVQDYDLTGMLVRTIADATEFVDAEAGGLLVTNARGDLERLSATSHRAAELETYQALSGEGPCVECLRLGAATGFDVSDVRDAWPPLADLMEGGGYGYVLATPLRWRGALLGGLNLFWSTPPGDLRETEHEAQIYSDLLTLFIVNFRPMSSDTARERVDAALEGRALVEQAKGVLVEREGLDMAEAYGRLLEQAHERQVPLTRIAVEVVAAAQSRNRL
jgi:hypothetical protein